MVVADTRRNNVVFFEHLFLGVSFREEKAVDNLASVFRLDRKTPCGLGNVRLDAKSWLASWVIQVGDMDVAHAFYEEGLGLVYDPSVRSGQKKGVGVSWLNIGDQQVHKLWPHCQNAFDSFIQVKHK